MHAQLDNLSHSLSNIEDQLKVLKQSVQDMEQYGTKFSYQWQKGSVQTGDVELAKSSILS